MGAECETHTLSLTLSLSLTHTHIFSHTRTHAHTQNVVFLGRERESGGKKNVFSMVTFHRRHTIYSKSTFFSIGNVLEH